LYDVVATVRGALGKLRAHACHCAAELDLQRNPRQRLDERGIFGLLGEILVKFSRMAYVFASPRCSAAPASISMSSNRRMSRSLICGTESSTAKHSSRLNSS
jgi:hypothetical protein